MAYSETEGIRFLLCLGLFVLASSFCHCTTLTRQVLDKLGANSTLSQGQAKGRALHHGRLLIGKNSLQGAKLKGTNAMRSLLHLDTDYQADMGWVEHKNRKAQSEGFSRLQPVDATVERLLKLEPKVECTVASMKLQVQDAASTPGSLFFVDRGSQLSPLPLSKLPPSCGYTVRSTQRELVLVAPYDACFVAHEADSYVLPLRWLGVPVRMSCPLTRQSSSNPPMVTCYTQGMVVKTEWTIPVAEIKVNLNGSWEPLMRVSTKCGFSIVAHPEGVVISVHYAPCLEKKGGMYTLELAGDGETKISCPSLSLVQSETPSKLLPVVTPSNYSAPGYVPTQSPQSSVPQLPGFPQNPEAPNEKPKDIYQPHLPYVPFYPSFFHPQPGGKPSVTVQPPVSPVTKNNELQSLQTVHPSSLPVPQPFVHFPFYPWVTQPEEIPVEKETPVATQTTEKGGPFHLYPYNVKPPNTYVPHPQKPETKPLPSSPPPASQTTGGQRQQPYYPFQFYPQPPKPETPPIQPTTKPPQGNFGNIVPNPPIPFVPPQNPIQPPVNQPEKHKPYPFPPYLQPSAAVEQPLQPLHPDVPGKPLPEKTMPPKSPASQGQIYPPFSHYPRWPQGPFQIYKPFTEETSTAAPKGKVQQPLSPLQPPGLKVPHHHTPTKPSSQIKEPSQPESPQGQVHQYPYPFYPQPQPTEKPIIVQQPSQPESPQGQVHQYPYPFYPKPQPTEKPTTVQKPLQPESPQGQVHHYPYPFYPQPTENPTIVQKPSQPESPQGQVHQYPYPFYPQPQPTEKPTTIQKPSQPESPQGQVHQYPYPVYPQPQPTEKPTTVQPSQPESPQGQVHQYPYPFYPQPQPTEKPTTVQQPSQPESPQGQVHQYPYPFYPQPQPTEKPTTVQQPSQPESPQGQVHQYPYPFYPQPQPTKKPTTVQQPSQPESPQGQVHQYPYPFYPQPQPTEKPTTVQPSQPESPQGQVHQYPYPFYPQPQPTEKPTTVQQPSQPEPPQGQVHQYPYPFYPQPQPTEKPSIVQQPSQPESPQGQVHKYPYPFYPQPQPTEKPTIVQKPSQPESPQGQVHQYPYPVYPQPQPTEKPTTVQPSQPESPQGQVHQYPYPVYPQPQPTEKPTTVQQPSQPESPQGQVHQYPYPFYPQPQPTEKPTIVQKPLQPESPQGELHQYPYPFYPQPQPTEKPTVVQKPSQPESPQGQVHQYPYPFYPQPTEKPTTVQPSQPESPQGEVHQYPYPFYPQPQPTEKPTTVQQPSQPESPQGQVHQYPYPFYPQPQPTEKPTTVQQPSQPESPQGQVHQYSHPFYPLPTVQPSRPDFPHGWVHPYPFHLQPMPENQPSKKPVPGPPYPPSNIPGAEKDGDKTRTKNPNPGEQPPDGQVYHYFNAYLPQPPKLPSITSIQNPQPGSPYIPPLHCPQYCPSGFSNCCLQIAFHQHLHHIIPSGPDRKEAPPVYSALPFVPSLLYSGLDAGVPPQKPTEATQTSPQAPSSESEKQPHLLPPDGNPAVLMSISKQPINPGLSYPYFVPNSFYPNWPNKPQSEIQDLQSQSNDNALDKPLAQSINPVVQYKPYYVHPPEQLRSHQSPIHMNNPSGSKFMSLFGQYKKRERATNEPTAKEIQPSPTESSDSKAQMDPKGQTQPAHFQFPYMLQDAQAPTYNLSQPQIFVSGAKKSSIHNQTVHSYSEPKSYLLLQNGPPGKEPNRFHEAPPPSSELVHDANVQAQTHPQKLNPLQDEPRHLKWLGKKVSSLPRNVNYMPRPDGESEYLPMFVSDFDGPHLPALSQDSYSTAPLKPESLKNSKPVIPLGSSSRIPAQVPGNPPKQWNIAADHQANGLNQTLQSEGGGEAEVRSGNELPSM